MVMIYAILLAFTGLIFWSPGFYFTWVFNALFQLARYPVNLYPGWLRLTLTWVLPVAFMTTVPAQTLTGAGSTTMLMAGLVLAVVLLAGASAMFRIGLRRYASVSS
jgi:ABC-2 type transport system permease protein